VSWWTDWKSLGVLPFGGSDLMSQPAIVYDVLRLCESTSAEIENKRAAASAEEQKREIAKIKSSHRGQRGGR